MRTTAVRMQKKWKAKLEVRTANNDEAVRSITAVVILHFLQANLIKKRRLRLGTSPVNNYDGYSGKQVLALVDIQASKDNPILLVRAASLS